MMRPNLKIEPGVYGRARAVDKCEVIIDSEDRYCRHYAHHVSLDLIGLCRFHKSRLDSGVRLMVKRFDTDSPPLRF